MWTFGTRDDISSDVSVARLALGDGWRCDFNFEHILDDTLDYSNPSIPPGHLAQVTFEAFNAVVSFSRRWSFSLSRVAP